MRRPRFHTSYVPPGAADSATSRPEVFRGICHESATMLRRATLFSDICAPSPPASVLCVVGQDLVVPELSRFFGVVISMHYNEHAPPHFHARYGAEKATVGVRELTILDGGLSPRALGLVVE